LPRPIDTLEGMQKIDLVIKGMEDEKKDYHKRISLLETELEAVRASIDVIEKEADGLKENIGEVNLRISQANERINKNATKMRAVSGNRELKALNKETSTAGKIIRQAEKDGSDLNDRLVEQGLLKEAKELEVERITAEITVLKGELAEKSAAWGDLLDAKKAEREALMTGLSSSLYRIYESIREKRGGKAVVPLRDEACQGCYMHVPPQLFVRLKRGDEEIIRCPHCDRILFVESTAEVEAP